MPSPNEITISQLSGLIGTPDCPELLDVCIDEDFDDDPRLIPGAMRHPFSSITTLAPMLAGRRAIAICQRGRKLSQGTAAVLRAHGITCDYLVGGTIGWRDAGLPLVPAERIPQRTGDGRTVWVTRQRPKIDRIACPWLIRRFVDPHAQFLFVAREEVLSVAERFNATPFDVDTAFWGHRGNNCTFDTMIDEFALDFAPLHQLATIIRGADTNRPDLAPQVAGLVAASLGLSRMYRDDLRQLDVAMGLYDAFYRWARDVVDEGHECPDARKKA